VRYWNDRFSITNGESDISFPRDELGTLYIKFSFALSGGVLSAEVEARFHEEVHFDCMPRPTIRFRPLESRAFRGARDFFTYKSLPLYHPLWSPASARRFR
jgi:hypothetical protein